MDVLFPQNGIPDSKKWHSAGLSYAMLKALGINEELLRKHSIESIKSLFDEINNNEGRICLPDLSKLEKIDIDSLVYRLTNYSIDNAALECIKYSRGKSISYLELFCIVWNEQRYPKLCVLLGVK